MSNNKKMRDLHKYVNDSLSSVSAVCCERLCSDDKMRGKCWCCCQQVYLDRFSNLDKLYSIIYYAKSFL